MHNGSETICQNRCPQPRLDSPRTTKSAPRFLAQSASERVERPAGLDDGPKRLVNGGNASLRLPPVSTCCRSGSCPIMDAIRKPCSVDGGRGCIYPESHCNAAQVAVHDGCRHASGNGPVRRLFPYSPPEDEQAFTRTAITFRCHGDVWSLLACRPLRRPEEMPSGSNARDERCAIARSPGPEQKRLARGRHDPAPIPSSLHALRTKGIRCVTC